MQKLPPTNHGEGNPEAAARFNTAEQEFVNSARGKKKIKKGPDVRPGEEAELAEAERVGREHAKGSETPSARPPKR
jgi:hypothetical protein